LQKTFDQGSLSETMKLQEEGTSGLSPKKFTLLDCLKQ
jgi:hypothetical protein